MNFWTAKIQFLKSKFTLPSYKTVHQVRPCFCLALSVSLLPSQRSSILRPQKSVQRGGLELSGRIPTAIPFCPTNNISLYCSRIVGRAIFTEPQQQLRDHGQKTGDIPLRASQLCEFYCRVHQSKEEFPKAEFAAQFSHSVVFSLPPTSSP